jgi:hypothetical protein
MACGSKNASSRSLDVPVAAVTFRGSAAAELGHMAAVFGAAIGRVRDLEAFQAQCSTTEDRLTPLGHADSVAKSSP